MVGPAAEASHCCFNRRKRHVLDAMTALLDGGTITEMRTSLILQAKHVLIYLVNQSECKSISSADSKALGPLNAQISSCSYGTALLYSGAHRDE